MVLVAIEKAAQDLGYSDRKVSVLATGTDDTIRNIRRGSFPRIETLEAICGALGLEIYIGPPRPENLNQLPIDAETGGGSTPGSSLAQNLYVGRFNTDSASGLARFTAVDLPVLGWAKCSLSGHILTGEGARRASRTGIIV